MIHNEMFSSLSRREQLFLSIPVSLKQHVRQSLDNQAVQTILSQEIKSLV